MPVKKLTTFCASAGMPPPEPGTTAELIDVLFGSGGAFAGAAGMTTPFAVVV